VTRFQIAFARLLAEATETLSLEFLEAIISTMDKKLGTFKNLNEALVNSAEMFFYCFKNTQPRQQRHTNGTPTVLLNKTDKVNMSE
jgi:hypothetical protein